MRIHESIIQTIGSTPLVRFRKLGRDLPGDIVLKLEFFNPLGSVKDRIGLSMIEAGEAAGTLRPGMSVIEPTSGNTGVALAFVCAAKGYPLTLVMPETMSVERRVLLLMLGAEVILTPGPLGMRGAIARATAEAESDPGRWYMPSQFDNPANPDAHVRSTAEEIWRDTDGKADMLVSGVGTGGTLTGVGATLKARRPGFKVIAVEPVESAVLSGQGPGPHKIQGIGAGFVPKNCRTDLIDRIETVTGDEAMAMSRQVIRTEGIPVGISAGAAVVAALRVAALPESKGKMIVTIIPSYTERYLSTMLAEEARQKALSLTV